MMPNDNRFPEVYDANLSPGDLIELSHDKDLLEMWWYYEETPEENICKSFYQSNKRAHPSGKSIVGCFLEAKMGDIYPPEGAHLFIRLITPEYGVIIGRTWGTDGTSGAVRIVKVSA